MKRMTGASLTHPESKSSDKYNKINMYVSLHQLVRKTVLPCFDHALSSLRNKSKSDTSAKVCYDTSVRERGGVYLESIEERLNKILCQHLCW